MVELALGTVQFGLAYGVAGADRPLLPEISREILVEARKAGIRRLDTAPAYGDIEQRLNELIAKAAYSAQDKADIKALLMKHDVENEAKRPFFIQQVRGKLYSQKQGTPLGVTNG